ncbi:hypothetical protein LTR65_008455 [Meristemomyces frigidus]
MHMQVVHNCYSPKEAIELCSRAGVHKVNMRIDKMFFSAFMAGCLLAFACAATLSTITAPWYQENAPGLIRMIGALIFPWGLVAIILTGADLVTASFMFTTLPTLHRRISPLKMLLHLTISFLGNLAGSLLVVGLITGHGGVFDMPAYKAEAVKFATVKVVDPEWHMISLRGIGANWLVCLSCFLGMMAREGISKICAIWWPTFAFECLGFDHAVANMFFVPMGIYCGADISVRYYIWKSMIPTVLGNMVGGGLLVAGVYWYLVRNFGPVMVVVRPLTVAKQFLTGDTSPVVVDGGLFEGDEESLVGQEQDEKTDGEGSPAEHPKSAENMV